MAGDELSIIIRAILEKASKSQIEADLKNIEKNLKPLEIKTDLNIKDIDKYKEKYVDMQNSLSGITQKTKEWTKSNGETVKQIEHLKAGTDEVYKRVTETTTNYKKQRDELAKVNAEQSKYWNQRRKETLDSMTSKPDELVKMADYYKQLEKESAQVVKQTNAVTQSLLNQQNIIARRDFNWGKLITGINASTFDSGDNFSSYIKRQYGDSAELIGKFNDKQLRTGEIITQANFRVKEGSDKWRMYQATLNKTTGDMRLLDNGLKDVVNRQLGFNEAMKIAITRIFQWGVATSLVYGSLRQLKEGLTTLKEIDTALIDIAKVTNYTNDQMKELTQTAINAGQEFGRTAQEYLSAVTEFARAGMGKQSEEYAKLSLLLQNVGDVTAEMANETLLAANAGFQLGGSYEKLMEVIDKFNNISNLNATNVNKLSEAMKVGASVFNAAGMSLDETIAIIGTATASTQRAGSEISRAWRTILMNIRQVSDEEAEVTEESMKKAEKALNSIGIVVRDSPSTFRPIFEIIRDLGIVWNDLTQVQQAYVSESLAGKRQANVLISTLQNWDMVEKQLVESINAHGSALQENEVYMASWEAKSKQFSANLAEFWTNAINTDFIKSLIDIASKLIDVLDFLINNSISSFLIQVLYLQQHYMD